MKASLRILHFTLTIILAFVLTYLAWTTHQANSRIDLHERMLQSHEFAFTNEMQMSPIQAAERSGALELFELHRKGYAEQDSVRLKMVAARESYLEALRSLEASKAKLRDTQQNIANTTGRKLAPRSELDLLASTVARNLEAASSFDRILALEVELNHDMITDLLGVIKVDDARLRSASLPPNQR